MSNRNQILIMALIFVSTIAVYFVTLKLILDSGAQLRWAAFHWFFGAVAAYGVMQYSYSMVRNIGKKRHATLITN